MNVESIFVESTVPVTVTQITVVSRTVTTRQGCHRPQRRWQEVVDTHTHTHTHTHTQVL